MTKSLRNYARLGLVHHMLYDNSLDDPARHSQTLLDFSARTDIETFDFCLPYGQQWRDELIPALRASGKRDIALTTHLFPIRKLSFCSTSPAEQAQAKLIVGDMVDCAIVTGATGFVFASGGPAPARATPANREAFRRFCLWLCEQLAPRGITALLEPMDTAVDKQFLYGNTADCVKLIESLKPKVTNFGIELDMAHLPLLGESFEQAIRTASPYLRRVHLGNCITDKSHPLYGDKHPPIGLPRGEIDIPQLTEILRLLLDIGFLSCKQRGNVLIEMTPWPSKSVEETIADSMARLEKAWQLI